MQRLGAGFRQARQCGPCRGLPRGKPFGAPAGAYPCHVDTPTPRRGCRGEQREACAQWAQPPQAVSDPEFRQTTSGAHGSAGRADCLPRGKPPACSNMKQLCRKQVPPVGNDAPTPARIGTCRPKRRSHFSFGGERKVCKRKPAARRLREKGFYCPF